jgi:hypothetical protein
LEQIDSGFLKDQLTKTADNKNLLLHLQKGIKDSIYFFALRQFVIALIIALLVIWCVAHEL